MLDCVAYLSLFQKKGQTILDDRSELRLSKCIKTVLTVMAATKMAHMIMRFRCATDVLCVRSFIGVCVIHGRFESLFRNPEKRIYNKLSNGNSKIVLCHELCHQLKSSNTQKPSAQLHVYIYVCVRSMPPYNGNTNVSLFSESNDF